MRRTWIYLVLFIVLQIIKGLIVKDFISDYGEGRIEVKMNENKTIDFETLKFNEEYEKIQPAVVSTHTCKVKGKIETDVLGIGTNSYFEQAESLKMNNGAFFGVQAVREGRNVVVISDKLAIKLFGSDKGTGNICMIDGTTYQVVGVYKKYRGLWDSFLDDGRERIYFPITSEAAKGLKIDTLLISLKNREADLSINQLQQIQINGENSFIYNALDTGKQLRTFVQLPMNLLLLFIIFDMIKAMIKFIKGQTRKTRHKVVVGILCSIGICLILRLGMKPLYISPEALPPYNIFDIGFYIKYFMNQCTVHNYLLVLHLSNYGRIYSTIRNVTLLVGILQTACCFKIKIKDIIVLKEGNKSNGKEHKKNYCGTSYDSLHHGTRLWSKGYNSK